MDEDLIWLTKIARFFFILSRICSNHCKCSASHAKILTESLRSLKKKKLSTSSLEEHQPFLSLQFLDFRQYQNASTVKLRFCRESIDYVVLQRLQNAVRLVPLALDQLAKRDPGFFCHACLNRSRLVVNDLWCLSAKPRGFSASLCNVNYPHLVNLLLPQIGAHETCWLTKSEALLNHKHSFVWGKIDQVGLLLCKNIKMSVKLSKMHNDQVEEEVDSSVQADVPTW